VGGSTRGHANAGATVSDDPRQFVVSTVKISGLEVEGELNGGWVAAYERRDWGSSS
jgi:hypothetical protein